MKLGQRDMTQQYIELRHAGLGCVMKRNASALSAQLTMSLDNAAIHLREIQARSAC